jgi:LPPG:FO 2-phospho-L-lactate transferase
MRVTALSGGVGGARLLDGLHAELGDSLTAIVNTGDDLEHWGLQVSPDVDTVLYTLSGLADEARGWGLVDETFRALEMMRRFGGEDWFALGDRDLAIHLTRTRALAAGETPTAITARLARALGVRARILPMADAPCRTRIDSDGQSLPFQEWFVRLRAQPRVDRVWFDGEPPPAPGVLEALDEADVVIIGPSNPYVSIDPILSRPGVRAALTRKPAIAVSPIVGGRAVKGPLARMIGELDGREASADAVAAHYGVLVRGWVIEHGDTVEGPAYATATVMRDRDDRRRLAREVLEFARSLA